MRQRLLYLLRFYVVAVAVFVVQKWVFMALCGSGGHGVGDALRVAFHGLLLDVPVAGYLTALPLLAVIASVWLRRPLALRRCATPYYVVVALAVAAAFVADTSLYPFWHFKLDATVFVYLDSPQNAFASVSPLFVAWRVALALAYAALLTALLRLVTPRQLLPLSGRRPRLALTALLVAAIAPLAVSIRGGLGESTANIGKVYFSADEFANHAAVNPLFSMLYSLDKADNFADEFDYFDESRRSALFEGLYPATPSDTASLLTTRRPDVLIILMESYGAQLLEAVGGRSDISPEYNRLAREGILFTACYSNSFRTDRGTLAALSGYPAFPTLSVMKMPVKSRTLPCIAASLNSEGYHSTFLYGGDVNFTNMKSYMRTGGYADIVADTDFPVAERTNAWGANDDVTFRRLFDMIGGMRSPWHICFLTLSSHEPFEVPYSRLADKIPNAFAFTDHCFGEFVRKLKATPAWDNLLIVCLPDHGFQYPSDINHEQHHHNTMLWLGGAVRRPMVVDRLMNQSDMAATLLGQLGIDHSAYAFSRDVFSPAYTYPFAYFTFKEGIAFADSTGCTVYDIIPDRIGETRTAGAGTEADIERRADRAKAITQTLYDDIGRR